MLSARCITCGHILCHLELEYEQAIEAIDNDITLTKKQKSKAKRKAADKLLPERERYCCRTRLISYVDQIKIII